MGRVISSRDSSKPTRYVPPVAPTVSSAPTSKPAATKPAKPRAPRKPKPQPPSFTDVKLRTLLPLPTVEQIEAADAAAVAPVPRHVAERDVYYSVAGLGAYRSYRRWPGKFFPNLGLTVPTDRDNPIKANVTVHNAL